MRKLVYYVGTSIDGYIAGPNGEIDAFPVSDDHVEQMVLDFPEVLPTHVRRNLGCDERPNRRFGDVVMGRGTYEPATAVGIADPYAHLGTTVATTRALAVPSHVAVTSDPVATVRALKAESKDLDIWLAGGGVLAGALVDEIDELVVKLYPVVFGDGRRMVEGPWSPTAFDLVAGRELSSGCVQRTYVRRRAPAPTGP